MTTIQQKSINKIEDYNKMRTRQEILEVTRMAGAEEASIVCGSLFCKLKSEKQATTLKESLQKFFDDVKVNDTNVRVSGPLPDNEFAYDFVPVVDFRLNYEI